MWLLGQGKLPRQDARSRYHHGKLLDTRVQGGNSPDLHLPARQVSFELHRFITIIPLVALNLSPRQDGGPREE
jgi:hypothetical protein